jgi:alkylation response protein AidB-like acyl-CoA dehydrogenase
VDLEFSDEEAELRDNVRDVLAGICPPSVVRAVYERKGDPPAVWERMVELYWPALAIPEAHGGLGMGFLEVAIVAEELGRATVPSPFLATVTQFAPAIVELGGDAPRTDLLEAVAAGRLTGTLAIAERGRWGLDDVQATATPGAGGWVLEGTKDAVLDGASADEIVIVARGADGLGAFLVPRTAVTVQERTVIDPTLPIADLVLDGVEVGADRVLAEPGRAGIAEALERVLGEATVALAMATIGTCRVITEQTIEYAKQREQYGRPIGSFQALKHRMADMYLAVERASSLCWFAALTIAEEDPRRIEAAHLAKAAVGECQHLVVGEGLQLHGGIGFTWEHDLHFLLKRAKAGDALFGNALTHRTALAHLLGLTPTNEETAA